MENRVVFIFINRMVKMLGQTLGPMIIIAVFSLAGIDAVFFAGAEWASFK